MANFTTTGSDTFPAGHPVKQSFQGEESRSGAIVCTSTSYQDSGLQVSHTTALSSTNSYLIFEFYASMMHQSVASDAFYIDTLMRDSSNSSYSGGESITVATYPTYAYIASADQYYSMFMRNYCGLVTGMGMPATKSTWAAGDTLYFRLFGKRTSGNVYFVHNASVYNLTVTEVAR